MCTQAADVAVVKTSSPASPVAGQQVTYNLAVTNRGPATATNVTTVDMLPAGVTFQGAPAGCVYASNTRTVTSLPSGQTVNSQILVLVDANATGTTSNTAKVSADQLDLVAANNESTTTSTVAAAARRR